jgi:hypothetical protein
MTEHQPKYRVIIKADSPHSPGLLELAVIDDNRLAILILEYIEEKARKQKKQ